MNSIELYTFGDRLAIFLRKMLSHFDMRVLIYQKASTAFYNVFSSPLPSTKSLSTAFYYVFSCPLPFIMSFHVHCLVSSKKFKFKFMQGYPEKDIPRRWTKKREMNAIIVAREARDDGKKM